MLWVFTTECVVKSSRRATAARLPAQRVGLFDLVVVALSWLALLNLGNVACLPRAAAACV